MTSFQKTIKYLAMGFAVFLGISIIIALANLGSVILTFVTGENYNTNKNLIDFEESYTGVESIEIINLIGKIDIKIANEFKVQGNNVTEGFKVNLLKGGRLEIKEKGVKNIFNWFGNKAPSSKVVLYLPEDFKADKFLIEGGVSDITIDSLSTKELYIDSGVGRLNGKNIYAENVDIDGGVGDISLKNVTLYDVDIDTGVGNLYIQGDIFGRNEFNGGVGKVQIDLNGDSQDYDLDIDSGIGQIKVNGKKLSDGIYRGQEAIHWITIDGGIGEIEVNFIE